jgi:hypothetical protein
MIGPPGPSSRLPVQHVTRYGLSAAAADPWVHYDRNVNKRPSRLNVPRTFHVLYFGSRQDQHVSLAPPHPPPSHRNLAPL